MRSLTTLTLSAVLMLPGLASAQPIEATAQAEAAGQAKIGPKIELIPSSIDFGQIDDSKILTETVKLTNVGDEVLRIPESDGVKGSCGCTVPKLSKYVLEPGESVDMTVSFDPRRRSGKQAKTVSIRSEGSHSNTILNVDAFVIQRVLFVEGSVNFGSVDQGDTGTFLLHVRGMDPEFRVTSATSSREDIFETKILGTEVVQRDDPMNGESRMVGETTVEITLKDDATIGRADGMIQIETTDPVTTSHEVRAIAVINGDVRLNPAVVRLGALQTGGEFEQDIIVYSNKGNPFNIEKVVFVTSDLSPEDKELISITHEPLPEGGESVGYTVKVKGVVSDTMRIIRGKIVLVTDAPSQKVVSASVAGVVRQPRP